MNRSSAALTSSICCIERAGAAPVRAVLQVPDALKLAVEPAANCDRYNQLLRSRVALIAMHIHGLTGEIPCKPQLIEQLKSLRLRGMASALEESLTALSQKKLAPTSWLGQLLQAEMADRSLAPTISAAPRALPDAAGHG